MRKAFVVVGTLALTLSASGCWPQPGFDAGHSRWNPYERQLTSRNVDGLTSVWDTPVVPEGPESGVSGLMAVGDSVFATGSDGTVARLAHDSGEVIWHRVVDPYPPQAVGVNQPTSFRQWLFVTWRCCHYSIGGYVWLNAGDGELDGPPSVPVLDGPITDVAVAHGSLATLALVGPSAMQFTWGSRELVLDPASSEGGGSVDRFAIVGDRVMFNFGDDAISFGPECRPSSDPAFSCEPDWRTDLGSPWSTPAAVGDDAVVYTDPSGTVTLLDAATGALRWRAELGPALNLTAPVVTRHTIFVGTSDGRVAAFRARGCGAELCDPTWETVPGAWVTGLAAAGDVVYATQGGDLVAFAVDGCGEATCSPLVTVDEGGDLRGAPIIHAGRVIVGNAQGHVVAFGLLRPDH